MSWMNEFDIENTIVWTHNSQSDGTSTPLLAIAASSLRNLAEWTNAHSDGWAYWKTPQKAATELMALLEGSTRIYHARPIPDINAETLARVLTPMIEFLKTEGPSYDPTLDTLRIGAMVRAEQWPDQELVPYGLVTPWTAETWPTVEELTRFVKEWPSKNKVDLMLAHLLMQAQKGEACVAQDHSAALAEIDYLRGVAADRSSQMTQLERENQGYGVIAQMVSEDAMIRSKVLEEVCEQALQGGKHGVLVTTYAPAYLDRALGLPAWEIHVSDSVPYGEIRYRQVFDEAAKS